MLWLRSDGTVVPLGKPHDTGVTNPAGYTLNYNEFVVYDPRQIKMRYALQVRFDFWWLHRLYAAVYISVTDNDQWCAAINNIMVLLVKDTILFLLSD